MIVQHAWWMLVLVELYLLVLYRHLRPHNFWDRHPRLSFTQLLCELDWMLKIWVIIRKVSYFVRLSLKIALWSDQVLWRVGVLGEDTHVLYVLSKMSRQLTCWALSDLLHASTFVIAYLWFRRFSFENIHNCIREQNYVVNCGSVLPWNTRWHYWLGRNLIPWYSLLLIGQAVASIHLAHLSYLLIYMFPACYNCSVSLVNFVHSLVFSCF